MLLSTNLTEFLVYYINKTIKFVIYVLKNYIFNMKKILLIDDDIIILKTYEHIFKNLNYQLTAISDSKKGLEIAINEDFDVILTDNKMPNLTGIELILELKKVKKDVNIYLLTGFIEKDQLKLLKSIGVTGIIEKPFSSSQIISLLE